MGIAACLLSLSVIIRYQSDSPTHPSDRLLS